MSDFQSPETPGFLRPENPEVADANETPGLLQVIPVGVYIVAFTGLTQVRVGGNGPFTFSIYRTDQQTVDLPTIVSCTIIKPDLSTVTADPSNPSDPADTTRPIVAAAGEPGILLTLYVLYEMTEAGVYEIALDLAWGDVTASTPQQVSITCSL